MTKRGQRLSKKNTSEPRTKRSGTKSSVSPSSSASPSQGTQDKEDAPPRRTLGTPVHGAANILNFVEDLKRQWMATIDALVDPLAIVGRDYKIQKANLAMARMAGKDVREIVGRSCYEVFANRSSPCSGCQLLSVKGTSRTFDLANIRGDRYYEVTSQALTDRQGGIEGFVQIYRDRTEARKMQEQLAHQDKLASIGLLAGGVAHEINNPLGGILVFSQMLLRELPKDSSHYADVLEIEAATQRCKAIVESLLNFARQNPEGKPEKRAQFDILDAIRAALKFGEVSIPRRSRIEITTEFRDETHAIFADRNKLIQVFLNLIQNAIQAMPDGGSLTLRSETHQDAQGNLWGRYHVEDTGIGIPPENLRKIFDPFFTTKDQGDGTGLGLSLCFSIIHDLGGTLTVASEVDQGTTFTIDLPLETPSSRPLQAS